MQCMKIYLVGGAVRDQLLGRPHVERDFVVVGATPEDLHALGYRPVKELSRLGIDFWKRFR